MIPRPYFGLGEKPIGIDQLEATAGLQRVPLMHVAVNEHGCLVAVGTARLLTNNRRNVEHARHANRASFGHHSERWPKRWCS
jgi:hypothetical protein